MKAYKNIDQYIAGFTPSTQKLLTTMYQTIKSVVPTEAEEKISYGIPTFKLGRNVVHFAGYSTHIGFYPGSRAIADFAGELKGYSTSKGTVRFSLEQPLPTALITKIVKYCVAQNQTI